MTVASPWGRRWLLALLLCLPLRALSGAETVDLLRDLGVADAVAGLPAVLELAAREHGVALAGWRASAAGQHLSAALEPEALLHALAAALESQLDAGVRAQARDVLERALARRVRGRVEAAAGPDQFQRVEDYRAQLQARPPLPQRRELLRQLVAVNRSAELAAQLQGLAEAALLGADGDWAAALASRVEIRAQAMSPLLEDYYLYVCRHLRNDELRQYAALLAEDAPQQVLAVVLQELQRQAEHLLAGSGP